MEAIKVLIVDDNAVFLRAAMLTLSALPGVHVVGSARTGPAAMPVALIEQPDLILMDVHMPVMNGVRTAARMRAQGITAKIVLVSLADAPEAQAHSPGMAADGFIAKADFAAGIQRVIDGLFPERCLCPC